MSDDVLEEVPLEQVPQVLEELRTELPSAMVAYNVLSNAYRWQAKEPEKTFRVLRPSSSSLKGIFVIITAYHMVKVSLWATEGAYVALEDMLARTSRIDWRAEDTLFVGLNAALQQTLGRVLGGKGLATSFVEYCTAYWMPASQAAALQPVCPKGTHFGRLDETCAELINSRWTYGTSKTFLLVRDILRMNPCWGLFTTATQQLAAWCLTAEYGVGMLRTEEPHRGKGYARAVATHLFRQLGQAGVDIHLHVENNNAPAHRLFRQLGCLQMGDANWTGLGSYTLPSK